MASGFVPLLPCLRRMTSQITLPFSFHPSNGLKEQPDAYDGLQGSSWLCHPFFSARNSRTSQCAGRKSLGQAWSQTLGTSSHLRLCTCSLNAFPTMIYLPNFGSLPSSQLLYETFHLCTHCFVLLHSTYQNVIRYAYLFIFL